MAESESAQEYFELRDPQGQVTRVPMRGRRMIVGRGASAQIRLECQTVSREHAEIFRDPFDRLWVRDLDSRNGTLVNGQTVEECVLNHGDVVQVEDFTLTLSVRSSLTTTGEHARKTTMNVTVQDADTDQIKQLRDFQAPQIHARHIFGLTEFGSRLLSVRDRSKRLDMICQLMVGDDFQGQCALILSVPRDQPTVQPGLLCEPCWRDPGAQHVPHVSQTTLRALMTSEAAVIASTAPQGPDVVEMSIVEDAATVSAIASPLNKNDQSIDVLYVTFPARFGTGEWLSLVTLAAEEFRQSDEAWAARLLAQDHAIIERELERGRHIQMRLVPRDIHIEGLDIGLLFEPCRWVGGDYIDVVPMRDGRVVLVVADVCGKGLQAALISASLHSMVHTNVYEGVQLGGLVERLNDYLCEALPDDSFVTMVCVLVNPRTGDLECVNAGHPPAMLVSPSGGVQRLQAAEHQPLGILPLKIQVERATCEPGHVLALYSDGLSELVGHTGEMLGLNGLSASVSRLCATHSGETADVLAKALQATLAEFQGDRLAEDDHTFLLARRL